MSLHLQCIDATLVGAWTTANSKPPNSTRLAAARHVAEFVHDETADGVVFLVARARHSKYSLKSSMRVSGAHGNTSARRCARHPCE